MLTDQELQSLRNLGNEAEMAADEIARLHELLRKIGDCAHNASTGPAVPDTLWEIRSMAYGGIVA